MTGPSSGCDPLQAVFETAIYFGLVGLLWYAATIEAAGHGESMLTPKTGMRGAADILAVLFGCAVLVFGELRSRRLGSSILQFFVGITYLLWTRAIVTLYGRDLWLHLRRRRRRSA